LKSEWRTLVERFILNNLGKMAQEDVDAWLGNEVAFAQLLEPALKNFGPFRDNVLRELHQLSPSEIYDVWRLEHPELRFPDNDVVIVKLGTELNAIRSIVQSL